MTKRTKKLLRIGAISLAVILLIIGGALWYIAGNLEKIVKDTLVDETKKVTNGLYTLQIDEPNIKIASGRAYVSNIKFMIDSAQLYQLELKGERPRYTANITASSIEVDIDKLLKIRKGGNIDISHILITEPHIELVLSDAGTKHHNIAHHTKKQHIKLPFFNSASLDKIELINGSLSYSIQGEKDTAVYTIENFFLSSSNIRIDSFINLHNPLTHVKHANLEANKLQHFMLDSALLLTINKLSVGLGDSSLKLDSLAITPRYDKHEFAHKTPNHNDIIELSVKNATASGIHFNKLFDGHKLIIDSIMVADFSFWSYKNKQLPPVVPKVKPLFHQLVHQIKMPLFVYSISVGNGTASYEELSLNGESPGKINFTELTAQITGLSNMATSEKQFYTAICSGKVYGEGKIEATFHFPIDSLNDHFEISGRLGKIDLTGINPMIIPLANMEIRSGIAQSVDFYISGNSKTSKTNMTFLYNNLKVNILNPKKGDHPKRKFLSNVINGLLIDTNNPGNKKEPRKAVGVISERDRFLSNFNYWWRSIREGMLYSIGLPGQSV